MLLERARGHEHHRALRHDPLPVHHRRHLRHEDRPAHSHSPPDRFVSPVRPLVLHRASRGTVKPTVPTGPTPTAGSVSLTPSPRPPSMSRHRWARNATAPHRPRRGHSLDVAAARPVTVGRSTIEIVGIREDTGVRLAERSFAAESARLKRPDGCAVNPLRVDLLIRGARLIDGSGRPGGTGDLGVVGDRIAAIGELGHLPAAAEVDARGHVLSPGFIDTHTHDDRALLSDPLLASKVSQGVTTVVTGNCGISLAPLGDVRRLPPPRSTCSTSMRADFKHDFAEYLAQVNGEGSAVNAVCLVGHTTLRVSTLGAWDRPATAAERAAMRRGMEAAIEARTTGFSTCLSDPETISAPLEEVLELARPVAEAGGVYSTHLRDEADRVLDALEEAFTVGREGGVPVVVSHHKCVGPNNHGRSPGDPGGLRRGAGAPARWARRLPLHRLVDLLRSRSRAPGESDHHRVVTRPARSGRTGALHSRRGDGTQSGGGLRTAQPRRGGLLHHGRAGRPTCAGVPAHDDRLRWDPSRCASASPPVGHVSACTRALRARRGALSLGGGGPADDKPAGKADSDCPTAGSSRWVRMPT